MPPRRKRSTTRKSTSRASRPAKPLPSPPVAGPGERIYVLSVPFEERGVATANGARWDPHTRQTLYIGAALPYGLTPYASPDYSWERWVEDDLNGSVAPTQPSALTFTPRPHQVEAIDAIERAAAVGYRGFVEADEVGLGKTISAWEGALRVAHARGATAALVVCPKGVIPHWRRTIAALGDHGLRVVVINYDQTKKLLTVPDSAAAAKRTRTKNKHIATSGQPLVNWDLVLIDESHKIKNQSAQRSKAMARIARYASAASTAPFVIWMSATIGQTPTELGYLAPLFAQLTGASKSDLKDFGQWLADEGFCVTYNSRFDKWDWGVVPADASPAEVAAIEAAKDADLARIRAILFDRPDAPSIRRLPSDIAGWPEIQRIAHPVDLSLDQRRLYEQAWTAFRAEMRMLARGRDPKGGMAARLRFRQKASLVRVPGTVELILDLLENGHQVAVSVEFHETSDAIREALEAAKVTVAEYSGRNPATREQERLVFQRGDRQVMLFSVLEGISLHQAELLPDGTHASNVPRTTIVHDPRYSGLEAIQVEGRAHRDGQNANVYYTFAADTVEEKIVRTLVSRVLSTKSMVGDDVTSVRELEAVLEEAASGSSEDGFGFTPAMPEAASPATTPRATTSKPSKASASVPRAGGAPMPAGRRNAGASASSSNPVQRREKPMSPEERALRAALSEGRGSAAKPRNKAQEQAALRNRLRNG